MNAQAHCMADVYTALWLHEEGKLSTIQADAADACVLTVGHSQEALRVIAQSFWLGEQGIGSLAVLKVSRVAALPCQLTQPICMRNHVSGLASLAGMGSMSMKACRCAPNIGLRILCIIECPDTAIELTAGAARADSQAPCRTCACPLPEAVCMCVREVKRLWDLLRFVWLSCSNV